MERIVMVPVLLRSKIPVANVSVLAQDVFKMHLLFISGGAQPVCPVALLCCLPVQADLCGARLRLPQCARNKELTNLTKNSILIP
jgi:hypothetical protein